MDAPLSLSPLHQNHLQGGAHLAPFAAWILPLSFQGLAQEHLAVRRHCGIFDISHFAQCRIRGPHSESWLHDLLTTNPTCLPVGGGQSSRLRGARDAVAGDLFLYRSGPRAWFLAAPAAETFALLHSHLAPGVSLENAAPNRAALAVQGPHAPAVYQHVAGAHAELPDPNGFTEFYSLRGGICSIARTSLTSEDGFLFFCDADEAPFWWSEFTEHGAQPCGFAALDSLRRETSADPGPRAARPPEPPPDLPP